MFFYCRISSFVFRSILAAVLLFLSISAHSSGVIRDVSFSADGSSGYAVGESSDGSGAVFRSSDGGSVWVRESAVRASSPFVIVQLLSGGQCRAIDGSGLLLRSGDSGETWRPVAVTSPSRTDFTKALFVTEHGGLGILPGGSLLYTADGGVRWRHTSVGSAVDVCTDGESAYALCANGSVYASYSLSEWQLTGMLPSSDTPSCLCADGGTVYAGTAGGSVYYRAPGSSEWERTKVSGAPVKRLAVSGDALFALSSDGLYTSDIDINNGTLSRFTRVQLPDGFTPAEISAGGNAACLLSPSGDALLCDDTRGEGRRIWRSAGTVQGAVSVSVDNNGAGIIFGCSDGTVRHGTLPPPGQPLSVRQGAISVGGLNAVHASGALAAAVGDEGAVLCRQAQDSVWRLTRVNTPRGLLSVSTDGRHAVAGSEGGVRYETSDILREPFREMHAGAEKGGVTSLLLDGDALYSGTSSGEIYRTDNASGATYPSVLSPPSGKGRGPVNAVCTYQGTAWAAGGSGMIRKSPLSQGNPDLWHAQTGGTVRLDAANGSARSGDILFAVSETGAVFRSVDGGSAWTAVPLENSARLNAIHFCGTAPLYGMAVGENAALTTSDGGSTWTRRTLPPSVLGTFNSVYMTGPDEAWIAGRDGSGRGIIIHYREGSFSDATPSSIPPLRSVSFSGGAGFAVGEGGVTLWFEGGSWEKSLTPAGGENWVAYAYNDPDKASSLLSVHARDRMTVYASGEGGVLLKSVDGGKTWSPRESGTDSDLLVISAKPCGELAIGGDGSVARTLADGTDGFSVRHYYDRLGRLVASQNSEQRSMSPMRYSYTLYDGLGRVTETGEFESGRAEGLTEDDFRQPGFIALYAGQRREVVRTFYDRSVCPDAARHFKARKQENLRNRVSAIICQETYGDSARYDHATHYSYDMHGNVKELVLDNPGLEPLGHRYKTVRYGYDLVSGNVNEVSYQEGEADRYSHRYAYDADNRITRVHTGADGFTWDDDAAYRYYRHGPTARTELGDRKVQSVDYVYTLQGWIKAVNGDALSSGQSQNQNPQDNGVFAKDAFGYSLHYNGSDYSAIAGNSGFLSAVSSGDMADLFNGNISRMATRITESAANGGRLHLGTQVRDFRYDELNRLVASDTNEDGTPSDKYATTYSYDADGNIKTLTRNDGDGRAMDGLTYRYAKDADGNILSDRLLHVNDAVDADANDADIDDQGDFAQNDPGRQNYAYDKTGNLVKDKSEEIAEIRWCASGKVKEIIRTQGSARPNLRFSYDGLGNRISKTVTYPTPMNGIDEVTTYYARDAQGNVLAVYERRSYEDGSEELYLTEQHIYGSARLGMRKPDLLLAKSDEDVETNLTMSSRALGEKRYELTNHLGNVLAVVSDKRLPNDEPDIVSVSDYYPYGMLMPDRNYDAEEYRYGFGGHEKESEMAEDMYSTEYRLSNTRLGLWVTPDPLFAKYPSLASYNYCRNNPLIFFDLDGRKFDKNNEKKAMKMEKIIDYKIQKLQKLQKLQEEGDDTQEKIAELVQSKTDISDMRSSDDYFRFEKVNHKDNTIRDLNGKGLPITLRTKDNEITMFMDNKKNFHEPRHGGQIARKEINIDINGNITGNYTYEAEISAYRAEYSSQGLIYIPQINIFDENIKLKLTDPTLNIKKEFGVKIMNINQINKEMLKNMYDTQGINQRPIYLDYPPFFWKEK